MGLWDKITGAFAEPLIKEPDILGLNTWPGQRADGVVWRGDGWGNEYTGHNLEGRDKLVHGLFMADTYLDPQYLNILYYGNDLARRIVDGVVFDATRAGYTIKLAEEAQDALDQMKQRADALRVDEKVQNALKFARLYGGTGLLLGIQDLIPMVEPVNPEGKSDITYIRAVDKRYAFSVFWNENPLSADYGDPAIWLVGSYTGPFAYVHASRFIPIRGITTDEVTKRKIQGWGYPVLQPVYDVLRSLGQAEHSAVQVMVDMNLDVFYINGLIQAVGAGRAGVISERMHAVDMQKNTNQSVIMDKDQEKVERLAGNIPPGVQAILEHLMYRISAAADMPVNILFGRTPGGLNATGKFDTDTWQNRVQAYQKDTLRPIYLRIYQAIALSLGIDPLGMDITFTALAQPDPKMEADTAKTEAETHDLHMNQGVVSPDEVREHIKSKGKMKLDDKVKADTELKDPKAEAEQQHKEKLAAIKAKPAGGPPPGKGPPMKKDSAFEGARKAWAKVRQDAAGA